MTAIAVAVSVVLHVAVLGFMRVVASSERQRTVTVIDIDVAPIAPEAEAPPPPEEGMGIPDAGVELDAAPEPIDAGVPVDARRRA
ncbi:MAG: hypothetical protein K8M05_01090, partial [Deltaproteobacteria bacterium]|nr:hypothetical protein [Kofleriaceae bacterium]